MEGKITVFWEHKHYGFIAAFDSTTEYFFHADDLAPGSAPPAKGLAVVFDAGQWRGRTKAINVRILSSANEILGGAPGASEPMGKKEKTAVRPDALHHTKEVLGGGK